MKGLGEGRGYTMGTHRPLLPKPENLEQLQHDVCKAPRSGSRSKASNTLTACDTCRQRKIKVSETTFFALKELQ